MANLARGNSAQLLSAKVLQRKRLMIGSLVLFSAAALWTSANAQQQPVRDTAKEPARAPGQVTGSITVNGVAHTVTTFGAGSDTGRLIYKLQGADGSVFFSDRQMPGAKILDAMPVMSNNDAVAVANRERDYWRAREKELNQRLEAERLEGEQRRRPAEQRSSLESQEGLEPGAIRRVVRVAKVDNATMPQGFAPYPGGPGTGGRIVSAVSGR